MKVKHRNIFLYILLNIVTLGIYGIVAMCIIGDEINTVCEGDGKKQMHYLLALLLGLITCGIFLLIWYYKAIERLRDNAYRYNIAALNTSGSEYIIWTLLGSFIVVGPLIATIKFLGAVNLYADNVGSYGPLAYTTNNTERIYLKTQYDEEMKKIIENGGMPMPNNGGMPIPNNSGYGQNMGGNNPVPEFPTTVLNGSINGVSGQYDGYSFPIDGGTQIVIGKDPAVCNIIIDPKYQTVSRKHCSVFFDPQSNQYKVTDFSSNGTFVEGGVRIASKVPTVLNPGTVINIGNTDNLFRLA